MNCQDISSILDSCDVNALSTVERSACEAHAAACPHCGPQWVAYTRLARLPAPPVPQELAVRCDAMAAQLGRDRVHQAGPKLLLGAIFLVAGAATAAVMMGVPQRIAESIAPGPVADVGGAPVPAAEGIAAVEERSVSPAPGSFTVHLRSLRHDSPDPAAQRQVQEYYETFADGLLAVPGLILVDDRTAARTETPASFRVTIGNPDPAIAQQALIHGEWAATLSVEVLKQERGVSAGSAQAVYVPATGLTRGGVHGPGSMAAKTVVVPLSGQCPSLILCAPERIVEWQIKDLRMQVFPIDGSVQRELEAQFLDSQRPAYDQFQALNDLQSVTKRTGGAMSAAVVREALERIARTPDADDRYLYWAFLNGQRHPEMILPLIDMARQDPGDDNRRTAILQLATDFPGDPAARTALESIARSDPIQLNRKLAERALLGDGPWNDYVVATLKDTTQPVHQRLEPLRWMVGRNIPLAPLADSIFGEDKQALINLLVLADPRPGRSSYALQILKAIGSLKHPESAGMMLTMFDAAPDVQRLQLLGEHRNDPRVRQRLEQLAADSTAPTLQETAAGLLRD